MVTDSLNIRSGRELRKNLVQAPLCTKRKVEVQGGGGNVLRSLCGWISDGARTRSWITSRKKFTYSVSTIGLALVNTG